MISGALASFDATVTSTALYQVTDPGRLVRVFSELLKPGGVCVVVDPIPGCAVHECNERKSVFDVREVLHHQQRKGSATIGKHGFHEGEMRAF